MEEKLYSVSEAVRLIGVESHVLRYWEEELQMAIKRSSQGHRIYSKADIDTFCQVKLWKEKGIQLKAIRVLLAEQKNGEEQDSEIHYFRQVMENQENDQADDSDETSSTFSADSSGAGAVDHAADTYEIITVEKQPDSLQQFEQILRDMLVEIIEEQNEKLEQAITDVIREEMDDLYLQYDQIMREAAAALEEKGKKRKGRLAKLLERLL